jgi:hypothetical protein
MLAISVTLNVLWLFSIVLISALAGYLVRGNQNKKRSNQVLYLESEMLKSHEEILNLQKEIVQLEKAANLPYRTRVVPMKDPNSDQDQGGEAKSK